MSAFQPPHQDRTTFRRRRPGALRPTAAEGSEPSFRPPDGESSAKPARRPTDPEHWVYGRHAVQAALANRRRRWHRLAVLAGQEEEAAALVARAQAARRGDGSAIHVLDRNGFAAILPGAVHQGLALESDPLVRVVNLARALDYLKEAGFWIYGLDETAQDPLAGLDVAERIVIVLGSEGRGMRRLVRERCDFLARLPTRAAQPTLNVSNAAAVALYELVRGPIIT